MKESYIEDLVNHDDPESCVYCRKEIDEALTGAHTGRVLSRESNYNQDADVVKRSGKQHGQERYDEFLSNPARSETSSMYGTPIHENREIPFPPTRGRTCWEGSSRNPTMHGDGKSDSLIVPVKQSNEVGTATEEIVEGRKLTKVNVHQQNIPRTQGRTQVMPNELERIRSVAKRDKDVKFTALAHHITIDRLREAFSKIKRNASSGIDGETWATYAENLEENLKKLHKEIHNGGYKAKPSRRVYIPKSGGLRPLGVTALEDKICQRTVAEILNAIYEADFKGFSYGYRLNKSPHQALDALSVGIKWKKISWILDADLSSFYDRIDHGWMKQFIQHRIADKRILRLVEKWLKAGIIEAGEWRASESGAIQGSSLSPLLSNIYLHYALDTWVDWWRKKHARGEVIITRWADDFVVGFQYQDDALKFQTSLQERLEKFSLEINQAKTQLIRFGRFAKEDSQKLEKRSKPKTFDFLGMTHMSGQDRRGKFQIRRKTIRKRLVQKLKEIKLELRKCMHQDIPTQGEWLRSVVRGYFGYHAIPGNGKALETFRQCVTHMWYKTLRRRSQKKKLTWEKMRPIINRWLPSVKIIHPWPEERYKRYLTKVRA